MFQQQKMYYFNQEELDELMSVSFSVSDTEQIVINRYWASNMDAETQLITNDPEVSPEEAVAYLQKRLNEIGCNLWASGW